MSLKEAALIALDALKELSWHVAFAGDEPEFNEGGIGYTAIQALENALYKQGE